MAYGSGGLEPPRVFYRTLVTLRRGNDKSEAIAVRSYPVDSRSVGARLRAIRARTNWSPASGLLQAERTGI